MRLLRLQALWMMLLIICLPLALAEQLSRTYDANGNLISDGKYYREYNGLNQLVRVKEGNTSNGQLLEEYHWHPSEERIAYKKVYEDGSLKETIYYPTKEYIYIVNASGEYREKYVYQDGTLVAQITADNQTQAVHSDHLGSATLTTDSTGSVVEETFYSPYGEILEGGTASRFDYEGKEYSSVVEDYDFHFRKYSPDPPIFNQPDSLIQNVYDPQSLNRYAFERNNPTIYQDPDGHLPFLAVGLAVVGYGVLTAGVEAYIQYTITGKVYSPERILTSFGTGVLYAGAFATTRSLPVGVIGGSYGAFDIFQSARAARNYLEQESKFAEENLKCEILQCSEEKSQETTNVQTKASSSSPSTSNPSSNIDLSRASSVFNANYNSGSSYSRGTVIKDGKTTTIIGGGSSGSLYCTTTCSVYEGTKEERDKERARQNQNSQTATGSR